MTRTESAKSAACLLIILVVGWSVATTAALNPGIDDEVRDGAEWCDEHGDDLVMVHSVEHGGLHCDLPNGTTMHLNEVATHEN